MLAAASSFVGLMGESSVFSSLTPPISEFSVGTSVEMLAVGAAGCIAVDTAAASSIAAAPSLRTSMLTSELPVGILAKPSIDMMQYLLPANRVCDEMMQLGFGYFPILTLKCKRTKQLGAEQSNQHKMIRKT